MPLLRAGDRVGERLVVDRMLGEGAFAEVYRVDHDILGRQALKLFKRAASPVTTHRRLAEARLLSQLVHPNIVRVFDAGTVATPEGVRGWFTTEYVAGGSLERLVRAHRPAVPTPLAVEVLEQMAAGLTVAHSRRPPIVHRDVTLANVLVGYDADGLRVRLSDFGLARHADPATGRVGPQGTYAFMAPEVLRGQGCSCASDVWSLGVVAYRLLTNVFPYEGDPPFDPRSTLRFRSRLLPPSAYNGEVDPELDRLVVAMLRLRPEDRPADAGEVARALRRRRETVPSPTGPAVRVHAPVSPTAPTLTSTTTWLSGTGGASGTDRPADTGRADATAPRDGTAPPPAGPPQTWRRSVGDSRTPAGGRPSTPAPPDAEPDPSAHARRCAEQALAASRRPGELHRAADLMEEAVTASPALRRAYLHRLLLWRRRVVL